MTPYKDQTESSACFQIETSKADIYLEALRMKSGGADRDRTDDPLLAKQVLSQLSYSPVLKALSAKLWWAWVDSNYRPHPYQGCALTN
jgi:hypothetical protein